MHQLRTTHHAALATYQSSQPIKRSCDARAHSAATWLSLSFFCVPHMAFTLAPTASGVRASSMQARRTATGVAAAPAPAANRAELRAASAASLCGRRLSRDAERASRSRTASRSAVVSTQAAYKARDWTGWW